MTTLNENTVMFLRGTILTTKRLLHEMETTKNSTASEDGILPPDDHSHVNPDSSSDDEKTDQDSFLMFASVIVGLIVLAYAYCLYHMLRIWLCRVCCGREVDTRDVTGVLDGENNDAQIFNLDPKQRRAVLEAIFSETSKAVTEDDVYNNKLNRIDTIKMGASFDTSEDVEIPADVQIPAIATEGIDKITSGILKHDGVDETAKTWSTTKSISWNDLSDIPSTPAGDRTMATAAATTTTASTTSTTTDTSPQPQQQGKKNNENEGVEASSPGTAVDDNVTPTQTDGSIPQNIDQKNHETSKKPNQEHEDTNVVTLQQNKTLPPPPASSADSKRKKASSSEPQTTTASPTNAPDQTITQKSSSRSLQSLSSMDECDDEESMPLDSDQRQDVALSVVTDDDTGNDKIQCDQNVEESKAEIPDNHPPEPSSEQSLANSTAGVTTIQMESVTTTSECTECTYDDESEGCLCSICLSGYEEGNIIITSKHCTHLFHKECILEWLDNHDECPICRVDMVTTGDINKAATSIVGKTRMCRAVAALNASASRHRLTSQSAASQRRGGTSS